MSILWCGGEDIDFPNGGAVTTKTVGYDSDLSRASLHSTASGFIKSPPVTAVTSAWLHVYIFRAAITTNHIFGGLVNSTTGRGIILRSDSSVSDKLNISKLDGTYTTLATESGASVPSDIGIKIDMEVVDLGVSSTIRVYVNGSLVITYTGDTSVIGSLDSVWWSGYNSLTYKSYGSQFILADEDTRLMSLRTLAPDAAGDASEWTNGYANIDEVTNSDADTVFTSTAGQNFQCNLTGMPTGDYIVKAVKVVARMTDGVGGMGVKQGIKTNSTLALSDPITLGGVWNSYEQFYQNNPVTANRFTSAEIEALQLAFQSVAV